MSQHERDQFIETWNQESRHTVALLQSLPRDRSEFRPDAGGYSLGDLAWHLAEVEAFLTLGTAAGDFRGLRSSGLTKPATLSDLPAAYERAHQEAVDRVRALDPDWERMVTFFDGRQVSVRNILWVGLLHHEIHHRGQLVLICRLAGGTPPGIYGPTREESAKRREAAGQRS